MRYAFTTPAGWSRTPFPAPQRGVYLRAPSSPPSPESASILLFDAVAPAGTVEDQLAVLVRKTCEGTRMGKASKPSRIETAGYEGLVVKVNVTVSDASGKREEVRVLALIDAGAERLPISFVGGPRSLPLHQQALDTLLASIAPLAAPAVYAPFAE
jgi:hypothetical protein